MKMKSFKFVIFILPLLALIHETNSYPYNKFKLFRRPVTPYLSTCCQLEWTDIKKGDPLPKDYVKAATFLNRDWAFAGVAGWLGAKSNHPSEEPNWLGLAPEKVRPYPNAYPILTNPNNCVIGWYTTKFNREVLPTNPDWHFPRTRGDHNNGDFARYQGSPATVWSSGNVYRASSVAGFEKSKPQNYDLLYVDCKQSRYVGVCFLSIHVSQECIPELPLLQE